MNSLCLQSKYEEPTLSVFLTLSVHISAFPIQIHSTIANILLAISFISDAEFYNVGTLSS